jgi:hypothetical protein
MNASLSKGLLIEFELFRKAASEAVSHGAILIWLVVKGIIKVLKEVIHFLVLNPKMVRQVSPGKFEEVEKANASYDLHPSPGLRL